MNALVKKEIRLLLSSFLIGCVMSLSNWFLLWPDNPVISSILYLFPFVVCPAVGVMIALVSFGGEVSSGTFTTLLAQPVSRLKIWQIKILLLAVALLVVGVLWFGSFFCVHLLIVTDPVNSLNLPDCLVCAVLFALTVFSGGLWTVLLLRQVAAAFWFTLLVPGVILMIVTGFFGGGDGNFFEGMAVSVLGLYSLAGFFFARWLFLRAQDVQWSGGAIVMPEIRGLPAWLLKSAAKRIHHPRVALWWKEIQLHQSQFVMAFSLLLLHLGVIAARHFCDLQKSPDLKFVLEVFWGLWLVMPLLVGCAAVAEERKLGTLESQLCLPVKRQTQFTIKFSVVMILSVFLGVVMPLLLEGERILPHVHFEFGGLSSGWQNQMSAAQIFLWNCIGVLNGFLPLLMLAGIAAVIGGISFYVSSLMRNTLQTLAPAVMGILMGFFGLVLIVQIGSFDLEFLWHGPLPCLIVLPVMLLASLLLAFWNFQHVSVNWRMWRWNFFMLALAMGFAVTATTAVYHRFWEKFTPFELPHGTARLSLANPASLNTQWDKISVRLPDGKIWLNHFIQSPTAVNPLALMLGNIKIAMADGNFINGSNWLTVERTPWEFIGIKTDGSLWVLENPASRPWKETSKFQQLLVPFGNETNWSSFVPAQISVLLVKNDGTLWRWGVTNFNFKHHQWPGLRAFTPYRMGTESNWAKIYQKNGQIFLCKTDGSTWVEGGNGNNWNTNGQTFLQLDPEFTVQSVKNLNREKFRSVAQVVRGLQYSVGVGDDGTFRIWADMGLPKSKGERYRNYEWFPTDLQIGNETNWVAVAGDSEKIVTLKNDGSLWLWDFSYNFRYGWSPERDESRMLGVKPIRLGTHSDWIAISSGYGNVTALAADGSLWFWPLGNVQYIGEFSGIQFFDDNSGSHFAPLLDISRKPQFLGNVFGGKN